MTTEQLLRILYNLICDDVIAISENWLEHKDLDSYNITGYEVIHVVRDNKIGGECSIYVNNVVKFNVVKTLCFSCDKDYECATVELNIEHKGTTTVCCIYRAPGGNLDIFNDEWEELLHKLIKNKQFISVVISI